MIELGRRTGTTSWEPLEETGTEVVDEALVVLFGNAIFFANAGIFRRQLHQLMSKNPNAKHLIVDAVAIADIDYTGMTILSQVVGDLTKDKVSVALARVNDKVRQSLEDSFDESLRTLKLYPSVDVAVNASITLS